MQKQTKGKHDMLEKIQTLLAEVQALTANNEEELEALRLKYLSKKGIINALMSEFRNVPANEKREIGIKLNEVKAELQNKFNDLKSNIGNKEAEHDEIDLTRTPYPVKLGTRHPLSIVRNEIIDIFSRLGFSMADGPEVEDDWHVFGAMNFADDHPARDMQDTFFIQQNQIYCFVLTPVPYKVALWKATNRLFA